MQAPSGADVPRFTKRRVECLACDGPMEMDRGHRALFCRWCGTEVCWARDLATSLVAQAIRKGLLTAPKILSCADCHSPAVEYDHRDYRRPFLVEAVCHSCNKKRGPAEPFKSGGIARWDRKAVAAEGRAVLVAAMPVQRARPKRRVARMSLLSVLQMRDARA